jgi:hypothetical protein
MGLMAKDGELIVSRGRDFSLLNSLQTDSGAHPAFYLIGIRGQGQLFTGKYIIWRII